VTDEVPARFVVGTGRCGSTLLSRMLGRHERVLNLSEVFTGLDWGRRFAPGSWTGAEVAELLTTPNDVIDAVVGRGYDVEEVTYPFDRPGARFARGDAVPWIAVATLGHLTDDVDALLDEVVAFLHARPDAPVAAHYRALFAWLAARSGAAAWVERSGSSVDYVGELVALFPEARVVHLLRDGREVALSMRNHPAYRMAVQLFYGISPDGVDPADEEAVVDGWLQCDPPVELYGRYWSEQLVNAAPALAELPADRLLTVRFEDVVEDPALWMERLAGFLDLPTDDGFAPRAAALVRGRPAARYPSLGADGAAALDRACAPGLAVWTSISGG
jgi:hypothetical protein